MIGNHDRELDRMTPPGQSCPNMQKVLEGSTSSRKSWMASSPCVSRRRHLVSRQCVTHCSKEDVLSCQNGTRDEGMGFSIWMFSQRMWRPCFANLQLRPFFKKCFSILIVVFFGPVKIVFFNNFVSHISSLLVHILGLQRKAMQTFERVNSSYLYRISVASQSNFWTTFGQTASIISWCYFWSLW